MDNKIYYSYWETVQDSFEYVVINYDIWKIKLFTRLYHMLFLLCVVIPSSPVCLLFNILRPRQHGRHFPDDTFKCIFLNENIWIPIIISLKFVLKGPINNITALVQIMAWRRPGDKPLSELMMVKLPTHICVTRPQWDYAENRNYRTFQIIIHFATSNILLQIS